MKRNFLISIWMTLATTVLLGIGYPLAVTALAQWLFPRQANGEIIQVHGKLLGSSLIGQPFSSAGYFHSRPSEAGPAGYDPDAASGGASNLGPTNSALITRVNGDVQRLRAESPGAAIPVDLVTSSGSGLDPDITPAGAEFQVARVARERGMSEGDVRAVVARHTSGREWGFLGEARVNVLELNLELDAMHPMQPR
ncbi:MAG: potassium-transporting ATPase subunit KdpC [Candidatus Acidiferrales bacterium]